MPSSYTYPGIYIEEIPSGIHPIAGAATSNTAFVGFFKRGPMDRAVRITSFDEFVRQFGGLDRRSVTSYAIQQFYLNGGQTAFVVRTASGSPQAAMIKFLTADSTPSTALKLEAASPGVWGNGLQAAIAQLDSGDRFNLVVREVATVKDEQQVVAAEIHRNLSLNSSDPQARYVQDVLKEESNLVRAVSVGTGGLPANTHKPEIDITSAAIIGKIFDHTDATEAAQDPFLAFGVDPDEPSKTVSDGNPPGASELETGMNLLDDITPEIFNLLCLPRAADLPDGELKTIYAAALDYVKDKRAFLLVDIPETVKDDVQLKNWMKATGNGLRDKNAAIYFPRLVMSDPLNEFRPKNVASSGVLAGVYTRTDSERGVWKAPAGTDAGLRNTSIPVHLNDLNTGSLNQIGINVVRVFPIFGPISWGSRTMDGADQKGSEWKYVPVRRMALFIEESLYQGLKWVVFEPNDEKLWSQIRLNVGAFMHGLFRQGAFQGTSPREAYLVKCDRGTTTQEDINLGIVNIVVGFAPLRPAEFVVIKLQQLTGQSQS